jgi:hypothetical protein
VVEKGPELAGFLNDRLVSETADPWFGGGIDAFFSALEIPFPGNGDRGRDSVRKGELLRRKPKHLVLAGPFGRQVGEADYSHATAASSTAIASSPCLVMRRATGPASTSRRQARSEPSARTSSSSPARIAYRRPCEPLRP